MRTPEPPVAVAEAMLSVVALGTREDEVSQVGVAVVAGWTVGTTMELVLLRVELELEGTWMASLLTASKDGSTLVVDEVVVGAGGGDFIGNSHPVDLGNDLVNNVTLLVGVLVAVGVGTGSGQTGQGSEAESSNAAHFDEMEKLCDLMEQDRQGQFLFELMGIE